MIDTAFHGIFNYYGIHCYVQLFDYIVDLCQEFGTRVVALIAILFRLLWLIFLRKLDEFADYVVGI